ncbi:MAG TPA: YceI family protein [Verrucomicrobiae bacterium]|jgi:polyisoprenoid-binding protein YceI|nr:YceI family protein [Verrucomicrobiae bacterium]
MNSQLLALCSALALAQAAAAPMSFDFKDPKGVNNATFRLDAHLEAISGSANGVSGTVSFDPENPGATTGSIIVTTASLHVPNSMMDGILHSKGWLDAAGQPEIKFVADKLENVKTSGEKTTADAHGTFTLKGVSKEVTVPISLTYLKGKLGQRVPNMNGDLLVLRAQFMINRNDFAIHAHEDEDKVAPEIEVNLSIAGAARQ